MFQQASHSGLLLARWGWSANEDFIEIQVIYALWSGFGVSVQSNPHGKIESIVDQQIPRLLEGVCARAVAVL